MEKKEHTPQAIRLRTFVDKTGLTHTEFGRQCGFKSPRSMQAIYSDGHIPTEKALNKIIARFPQLNYDWVLMGYGEMITKPFESQPSTDSITKSAGSSFNQINKKLSQNDLAINELRLDALSIIKNTEQNLLIYSQSMAILTNKVEQMSLALTEAKKAEDIRIEKLDAERKEFMATQFETQILAIKTALQNNMEASKEMVTNFDIARKKRNLENAEKQTKEILQCLANGKDNQSKQINDGIQLGLKTFRDLVKKSTTETMTEFINFIQGNESAKKQITQLGKHTVNKKP